MSHRTSPIQGSPSFPGKAPTPLKNQMSADIPRPAQEAVSVKKAKPANNLFENGKKIKSMANAVTGNSTWRAPLQTHNLRDGTVAFVTIRVRALIGDAEQDFNIKFDSPKVLVEEICDAVAIKQDISIVASQLFSLWIIGKDLEMQLRPEIEIFEFMRSWGTLVLNNTHFPEARNYYHPINHHWFVYRKEASISIELERSINSDTCIILLYGEARRNILTGRYPCTVKDAAIFAGLQLQMFHGNYNPKKEIKLATAEDMLAIIPVYVMKKLSKPKWVDCIMNEYKQFTGMRSNEARLAFLEHARTLPCYGSVFFPVTKDIPPRKYFEFRQTDYWMGVHSEGVVMIDRTKNRSKYLYLLSWITTSWHAEDDNITFYYIKRDGRHKKLFLVSPQAKLLGNLCSRIKACWALRALGHNEPIAYKILDLEEKEHQKLLAEEEIARQFDEEFSRARDSPEVGAGFTPLAELGGRGSVASGMGSLSSFRSSIISRDDLSSLGSMNDLEAAEREEKEKQYMEKVKTRNSKVVRRHKKKTVTQILKQATTSDTKRISKAAFNYDEVLSVAGPTEVIDMRGKARRSSLIEALPSYSLPPTHQHSTAQHGPSDLSHPAHPSSFVAGSQVANSSLPPTSSLGTAPSSQAFSPRMPRPEESRRFVRQY